MKQMNEHLIKTSLSHEILVLGGGARARARDKKFKEQEHTHPSPIQPSPAFHPKTAVSKPPKGQTPPPCPRIFILSS